MHVRKILHLVLISKPKKNPTPNKLLSLNISDSSSRVNDPSSSINRHITDQIINKITDMNKITSESDRPNYYIVFQYEISKHVSG